MILYEYDKINDDNLKSYIKNTPSLHQFFKRDFSNIKAKQYCGIINFNNEDIYILPKISNSETSNLKVFIYMLRFGFDINLKNEDIASSLNHTSNNFLEVFIQLFAKNIIKEFQKGIYKKYITYQDNITILRGKYLINENLKHNFTKTKIYCEFDKFSEDNILNQFFLYAIKTLLPFVKDKKYLKMCELILDKVRYKKFDINNIHIHFDRLNNRYKSSFEFAILILSKFIPTFDKGKKSFAFLFDMNVLFEKFIGNIYKSINNTTILQKQGIFGNLSLRPDIYTNTLIIDTKYKKVKDKYNPHTNDKYQMFVYGINFKIKDTMLLYTKHNKQINKDLKLGEDDIIINMKMRSIDLNFNGRYEEYITEIKNRIKKI